VTGIIEPGKSAEVGIGEINPHGRGSYPDATIDDAWLAVHVVGALIRRLASDAPAQPGLPRVRDVE
jgi:hypothetical protein